MMPSLELTLRRIELSGAFFSEWAQQLRNWPVALQVAEVHNNELENFLEELSSILQQLKTLYGEEMHPIICFSTSSTLSFTNMTSIELTLQRIELDGTFFSRVGTSAEEITHCFSNGEGA